jgi:hypothetical protein
MPTCHIQHKKPESARDDFALAAAVVELAESRAAQLADLVLAVERMDEGLTELQVVVPE